jgi:hypothetical protein
MDERAGEHLLFTLCQRSTGDVHLDLAELDSIDVLSLIALLRGAEGLCDGRKLVLHNAPATLRPMLDVVREAVGESAVHVE